VPHLHDGFIVAKVGHREAIRSRPSLWQHTLPALSSASAQNWQGMLLLANGRLQTRQPRRPHLCCVFAIAAFTISPARAGPHTHIDSWDFLFTPLGTDEPSEELRKLESEGYRSTHDTLLSGLVRGSPKVRVWCSHVTSRSRLFRSSLYAPLSSFKNVSFRLNQSEVFCRLRCLQDSMKRGIAFRISQTREQ
jgi:hypothetical protein